VIGRPGIFAYHQSQFRRLPPLAELDQIGAPNAKQRRPLMKRYVIEREIPGVGAMTDTQLAQAATTSNAALAELNGKAQWVQSYVADNKTFCVYLAESEDAVRDHARISGFPANKITEISDVIDPMTAARK
jgi:Nickel responsive protein SCO4226-like